MQLCRVGVVTSPSVLNRRRLVAACISVAALVAMLPRIAAAAPQTYPVEIHNNVFIANRIYIAPGDTVEWTAIDPGHTVTADDSRFNFYPQRFLNEREKVSWTFLTDETVAYHCRVHGGQGMTGLIIVGAGSPAPTPTPTAAREERAVPSLAYPTINGALNGIPQGSLVRVAPGVYHERVVLSTPGVTIRGDGVAPGDVTIQGGGTYATGVVVAAAGAGVENLAVRGFTIEDVAVRRAKDALVRDVITSGARYGIIVSASTGAVIERAVSSGSAVAGISVSQCADCEVLVQDSTVSASLFGILVDNAGGTVLRRNLVQQNATGIAVRTLATSQGAPQAGVHVYGNTVRDNDATIPAAGSMLFAVHSGIWIAGGVDDVVEANDVRGSHEYGILISSLGVPSLRDRVSGNIVAGASHADLAWDGVGASVCFQGNTTGRAADPTTSPPMAQTIYGCGSGTGLPSGLPAGVPEPTVLSDLALYALAGTAGPLPELP